MTTVVFTEQQVAADGRMLDNYGTIQTEKCKKVFENKKYIVGIAGAVGQCQRVRDWIFADFKDAEGNPCHPYIADSETLEYQVAFVDKSTGKVFSVEGASFDIIELSYPVALGSGAQFALGYLAGKVANAPRVAERTIKIVSKLDAGTNDQITFISNPAGALLKAPTEYAFNRKYKKPA